MCVLAVVCTYVHVCVCVCAYVCVCVCHGLSGPAPFFLVVFMFAGRISLPVTMKVLKHYPLYGKCESAEATEKVIGG